MDAMRAMLDELMGKERNVPLGQRKDSRMRYDDPSVCKYALGGLCPYGLFRNTRSDLGSCGHELHEDHLAWEQVKADYDKQDSREHERYERRLIKVLEDLIREMDRKIQKSKERAEAESSAKPIKPEDIIRLAEIQNRAKDLLIKSQQAGEQGDVDVSMALAAQAEDLQQQHDRLHRTLTAPDRTMMVCDICGVFINSTDNEQRRQEHLTGKQFLGWKQIREKHAELMRKYEGRAASREPEGADRPRSSSYPVDDGRSRDRDRDRDRDRERDSHRDRERERSPRREDRGRSYDERGRGYDSSRRDDRDRDRDRDRGRDYSDRDRGRDYDRSRDYDRGRDHGGRQYEDRRRY